jgi:uncharacterized damage-inducible protein DinB
MKLVTTVLLFAAALSAQGIVNPLVETSKAVYGIAKNDVTKSTAKVPDALWSYRPTKDIRTFGQVFAHIADTQYEFCGPVNGETISKDIEKTATTKAQIVAALKDAFAYCDATYAKLNDAKAAETVKFFGMTVTKLGLMDFNIAHVMEHYGNLVTYMRLNNIVPPSSEQGPPPAAKK